MSRAERPAESRIRARARFSATVEVFGPEDTCTNVSWAVGVGPNEALRLLDAACEALRAELREGAAAHGGVEPCPSCGRLFRDGETCHMGGCPRGGDF